MEIKVKKGDHVILSKIDDHVFNGNHPNAIYVGYVQHGRLIEDVTVGQRCNVIGKHWNDYLSTSKVVEIIDEETFKTENSTYKIILDENNQV